MERLRHLAGAVPGSHASDASFVEMSSLRYWRALATLSIEIMVDEISFFREFKLIEDKENIEDSSVALKDLVVVAEVHLVWKHQERATALVAIYLRGKPAFKH